MTQSILRRFLPCLIASLMIAGCASMPAFEDFKNTIGTQTLIKQEDKVILKRGRYDTLPGWKEDDLTAAIPAFAKTCEIYLQRAANEKVGHADYAGTYGQWHPACLAFRNAGLDSPEMRKPEIIRTYFEQWFHPYLVTNNHSRNGLFTGYYEASLKGSLIQEGPYKYPLYSRPDNLVMAELGHFEDELMGKRIAGVVDQNGYLKPFFSREDIEKGALSNQDLELVWVDDPVDAFFLQIQGSGQVLLPDGRKMRVGFDGYNGHPYRSIGSELIAMGELEKEHVSMQSIREWIRANPSRARALLNRNPSYVFFKQLDTNAPVGAMGLELTPERSLAVDKRYIPLGAPLWVKVNHPINPDHAIQRLMVAQDTGGAIKGVVRGDYYWGYGERAEYLAGLMKSDGHYWILLPKLVEVDN